MSNAYLTLIKIDIKGQLAKSKCISLHIKVYHPTLTAKETMKTALYIVIINIVLVLANPDYDLSPAGADGTDT